MRRLSDFLLKKFIIDAATQSDNEMPFQQPDVCLLAGCTAELLEALLAAKGLPFCLQVASSKRGIKLMVNVNVLDLFLDDYLYTRGILSIA